MTFIITLTAFLASLVTLFSGFGLGTILMPVVAIFFPVAAAIALTAFVHLANNLFKLALLWRHINWQTILHFGLPAMVAAVPGALLLTVMTDMAVIATYDVMGVQAVVTPLKILVGVLLFFFATAEWLPILARVKIPAPVGGALSGFFGGLSGHQGAFRSAFLVKADLDKKAFVACNAAIASVVDIARLVVYGLNFDLLMRTVSLDILGLATAAAFAGAALGTALLQKVTIGFIQKLVAVMLYILGAALISGVI